MRRVSADSRWLSIGQTAKELGVSTSKVKQLDRDGILPHHHRIEPRGDRRFDRELVLAYRRKLEPS